MSNTIEIRIPDLGEFDSVPIVEIFVNVGDTIAQEDPLLSLESDKATMEIPSSDSGVVADILVSVGDQVSTGDVIIALQAEDEPTTSASSQATQQAPAAPQETPPSEIKSAPGSPAESIGDGKTQLVVLGSGPGGYTAAFRAADLGLEVTLIERYDRLGGVCLNVGCIPSKALLHVASVINESKEAAHVGLLYADPEIDLEKTRQWKSKVVGQLTQGLSGLAKKRKVTVLTGTGRFTSANQIEVESDQGTTKVDFDKAIIAAGSQPVEIPSFPNQDPRVIDSTGALDLSIIPERMLIIGGGIIGLEMATVYHALGSKISIVEMMDNLMNGADPDLVRPLAKRIKSQYENIWLGTKVTEMTTEAQGVRVKFEGPNAPDFMDFDQVLVCVGRTPNGHNINAQAAGVQVTERGFIEVNQQQQTNIPHIFAIGDVVGQPMLAHKAVHEGKVAAEVAAGLKSSFDAQTIPSVAYTDPEVAWTGITETEAKAQGIEYEKGSFPWAASGRALTQDRSDGVTKLLFDKTTKRLIGAGICGTHAGDLIAEATLAIEMGADGEDIGLTIHPHPTLAETLGFAAEAYEGTITDLYLPKKK